MSMPRGAPIRSALTTPTHQVVAVDSTAAPNPVEVNSFGRSPITWLNGGMSSRSTSPVSGNSSHSPNSTNIPISGLTYSRQTLLTLTTPSLLADSKYVLQGSCSVPAEARTV